MAIQQSISCLVIDADSASRVRLATALRDADHRLQIQPCESPFSAQIMLTESEYDVWFLDIDLPGMSAFGFLDEQHIHQVKIPPVVFTTNHRDFALRSFDYPVLDYLLKPLTNSRVAKTVDKLDTLRNNKAGLQNPSNKKPHSPPNSLVRFKNGSNVTCLRHADILWIEAAGDYMCVHTSTETQIIRSTMSCLERQLSDQNFVRISRSALVNWQNVKGYKLAKNGSYQVELIDQQQLSVSRKYKILISEMTAK